MEIIVGIVCLTFGWFAREKYDAILKQPTIESETEEERDRRLREERQIGNLFAYNENTAMKGDR